MENELESKFFNPATPLVWALGPYTGKMASQTEGATISLQKLLAGGPRLLLAHWACALGSQLQEVSGYNPGLPELEHLFLSLLFFCLFSFSAALLYLSPSPPVILSPLLPIKGTPLPPADKT